MLVKFLNQKDNINLRIPGIFRQIKGFGNITSYTVLELILDQATSNSLKKSLNKGLVQLSNY